MEVLSGGVLFPPVRVPFRVSTNTTMNAARTIPAMTITAMVLLRSRRCFCSLRVSFAFSAGAGSAAFGWVNRRSTNSVMVRTRSSGEMLRPAIITEEMFAGMFRFIIIGSIRLVPFLAIASVGMQPVRQR